MSASTPAGIPHAESLGDRISDIVLGRGLRIGWLAATALAFFGFLLLMLAITVLFVRGVGIWGIEIPVAWGFAIINFVWWIGIGHAGTFISAFLLLLRQDWRTTVNRFAESMTLFAIACAGLFPLLHLGRPGLFYWLIPYPNEMTVWPQFRSPLIWDFFAVGTYATVSLLFWYAGLLPDLAVLRDRAAGRAARIGYGVLALGWRGSARHWRRYRDLYLLLAALATPLVISVHSVVSLDFTVSILPGWHSTIFPPYFVAGAIFSGFAMVFVIVIPLRKIYRLEDAVTPRHLDLMAQVMLATGEILAYSYLTEAFMAWWSGDRYEMAIQHTRYAGLYTVVSWVMLTCNVAIPQLLWWERVRRSQVWLFLVSLVILVGMWLERYVIIVSSLSHDFLPTSWGIYRPTFWDWLTLIGSVGLFFFLFLLFVRLLPAISISEVRAEALEEEFAGHAPRHPAGAEP